MCPLGVLLVQLVHQVVQLNSTYRVWRHICTNVKKHRQISQQSLMWSKASTFSSQSSVDINAFFSVHNKKITTAMYTLHHLAISGIV